MGTTAARTLLVLRHAKAAAALPGTGDEGRPLTSRGQRDAVAAGRWLRDAGVIPDLVLCSPARRARQTWRRVRSGLGPAGAQAAVIIDPRLYLAGADDLLEEIRQAGGEAGTMLVVGHNPASHDLVLGLAGAPAAFPTCSLAVVRLRGGWDQARPGHGWLATCWTPSSPVRPAAALGTAP